jgi:hypothetical protein
MSLQAPFASRAGDRDYFVTLPTWTAAWRKNSYGQCYGRFRAFPATLHGCLGFCGSTGIQHFVSVDGVPGVKFAWKVAPCKAGRQRRARQEDNAVQGGKVAPWEAARWRRARRRGGAVRGGEAAPSNAGETAPSSGGLRISAPSAAGSPFLSAATLADPGHQILIRVKLLALLPFPLTVALLPHYCPSRSLLPLSLFAPAVSALLLPLPLSPLCYARSCCRRSRHSPWIACPPFRAPPPRAL